MRRRIMLLLATRRPKSMRNCLKVCLGFVVVVMAVGCVSITPGTTSKYFVGTPHYGLNVNYQNINIEHDGFKFLSADLDYLKESISSTALRSTSNMTGRIYDLDGMAIDFYYIRSALPTRIVKTALSIIPVPFSQYQILEFKVDYDLTDVTSRKRISSSFAGQVKSSSSGWIFVRGKYSGKAFRALKKNALDEITNKLFSDIDRKVQAQTNRL
jgi:hypothetical protein